MKESNIAIYNAGLFSNREPEAKDIVWFSEKISNDEIVLDCGSGSGYYLRPLKCEKIGLDISKKQLQKMKTVDDLIQPILGDVENLPLQRGSVDSVLAFSLLHHLPDKKKGLDEMRRVLNSNGYLFIMDSNLDGLGPIYPLWLLTLMIYNLRGRFAEGIYPKLGWLEQYFKLNGFSFKIMTEHSFYFSLFCILNLYLSYLPRFFNKVARYFQIFLLKVDAHVSKSLPYKNRLSIKITAKLNDQAGEIGFHYAK
jgi:SAM-dependent methyltransferase